MKTVVVFGLMLRLCACYDNLSTINTLDRRELIFDFITDVVKLNLKNNNWKNFLCIGHFPDKLYSTLRGIPFTTVVTNIESEDYEIEDVVPYQSNVIVIEFKDFNEFEDMLRKAKELPYWHPHSNIIIYYHDTDRLSIAKIFYILWFYKVCNAVIIQFNDETNTFIVSYFSPFVSKNYQLDDEFGCWTTRDLGSSIKEYQNSFMCVEKCMNVTSESKFRGSNLGTCIGIKTHIIKHDLKVLKTLDLFEDKGKNLHGFALRAYTTEVLPFMKIDENSDGTYTLGARDGTTWNVLCKLMNFTIDLSPSKEVMKRPFNVELNIQQVFSLALRKADLFLIPIYQFDMVVIEVDYTYPVKDSGVCFASHRAGFETILFDTKVLYSRYTLVIEFIMCLLCVWLVFFIFNVAQIGRISLDQIGKDLLNTVRHVLLINLHKPPIQRSFRIFMAVSLWSFFILNFFSQATVTSFFTAIKRGKEVETYDDIIERGYPIEGMASPDVLLPDTEDKFRKISSKLVPIQDIFACIRRMANDSKRFCLIDCSVGRYLERNLLNDKGEQYLHIATDRIHSHYLNIIYPKYSVLSAHTNRYLAIFVEAGLIKKWEQYRFKNIKSEAEVKPLDIKDFIGIFNLYCFCIIIICGIFLLEVLAGNVHKMNSSCLLKFKKLTNTRITKKKIKLQNESKRINNVKKFWQNNKNY